MTQQQVIIKTTSPHIRKKTSTTRMMVDVLIALLPVVGFAIYRFQLDAVLILLVSLVIMIGIENLSLGLIRKGDESGNFLKRYATRFKTSFTINNITAPAISAVIFSLLLPSKTPLYVVAVGALFAISIGKMIFGGLGKNLLNPAALGRLLLGLFFGAQLLISSSGAVAGATPLGQSFPQGIDNFSLLNLFIGIDIPGAMGEVSSICILVGMAYLLIRRAADWRVIVSAAIPFIILALIAGIGLGHAARLHEFVLYQILSGGLLFGLAFMITDPVTSPVTKQGRWIYGLIVGVGVALIRFVGSAPEGVAMALIFANLLVPLIDYNKKMARGYSWKMFVGYAATIIIMIPAIYYGVGL